MVVEHIDHGAELARCAISAATRRASSRFPSRRRPL